MAETPTPQPMTVLVVDDHEANRALAQSTLEDEGYRVVLAHDGVDALATFERERPDCVLLDLRMPGLDGFAVCAQIRALAVGADTPVLFLTALRDVDAFDQALRAGGDDFLTKPVRPTELVVRVQSALRLRRLHAELREHYELLKRQRDALLRLQLQKERLTTFVVHDLKNPVHTLDLYAQLLQRESDLPEHARESAGHIRSAAAQLTRLILNLLDLSKADEGELAPRRAPVDLRSLVDAVLSDLALSASSRKVTLRAAVSVERVTGDEDLLRRMLTNLVENALWYAPAGSVVRVSAEDGAEHTEMRVTDAGPGIPEELRTRVFDPFVQVDAGTHSVARAGRGLGLAFCRVVAQAHGGRIWVEDAAPGAIFCVTLPRGEASALAV